MRRIETMHGVSLVLFGLLIPVGEGAALGALGLFVLASVLRFREIQWGIVTRHDLSRAWLSGWGVWLLLGLGALYWGGEGWLKPGELARWFPILAVPLLICSGSCLPKRWYERAATAFFVAVVVAACFGLYQYFVNVRPFESWARLDTSVATQGRVPGHFDRSVAGGFFFHRLKMAHVLLVAIGGLVARQIWLGLSKWRRVGELALVALLVLTLALTFARAALFGALAAGVVVVLSGPGRWRKAGFVVLVIGGLVVGAAPEVRSRVVSAVGRQASDTRALIWSQGVRIIVDHPMGAGLGNYPRIVERYYDRTMPSFNVRTYPHSLLLSTWAEAGPLGMAAFVFAWVFLAVGALARLRAGLDPGGQSVACCLLFVTVAFWVVGLTHDVFYHQSVALAFFGAVGWSLSHLASTSGSDPGILLDE